MDTLVRRVRTQVCRVEETMQVLRLTGQGQRVLLTQQGAYKHLCCILNSRVPKLAPAAAC